VGILSPERAAVITEIDEIAEPDHTWMEALARVR
jgi:hypothetical protein